MQYYLIENEEQVGPLSIEELSQKRIHKDSLIWLQGLDDWTKAQNIPMLQKIIGQTPPPYKKVPQPDTQAAQLKTPAIPYFGYQLASKWERFLALFISSLIIFIPVAVLTKGEYLNNAGYFTVYDFLIEIIRVHNKNMGSSPL